MQAYCSVLKQEFFIFVPRVFLRCVSPISLLPQPSRHEGSPRFFSE